MSSWHRHWHLPLTDTAGLDTPPYRQTEAQSQHNQCPYTISHWILFHITCVLFLHAPCCCMLGVPLPRRVQLYVGRLSYTPCAMCFMSLSDSYNTHPLLFYVGSLSYTPCAVYVENLFDTPRSVLCGEFVLDILCYFMWEVSILCGEFL